MKRNIWIISVISLAIGAALFLLNLTQFYFRVGAVNVNIYPAAFFTLLGGILAVSELLKNKAAE